MDDATAPSDGMSADEFARWREDIGRALESAESARIAVYVRSLLPPPGAKDAQTDVLASIQRAVRSTPIDDVAVNVWGERLCLCEMCCGTDAGRAMLDTVGEFERWGDKYDASATPFFDRTHHESSLTSKSYEGIVPPRVTAALYVDGSLAGVFPARFGETAYSVHDFSESISRLAGPETVSDAVDPLY